MIKLTSSGKRIRVLVTRPKEDAAELTKMLALSGVEVIEDPMLTIMPQAGAKPTIMAELLRKPQAILISSSNGVRALAKVSDERNIPLIAVGATSAESAKALGFKHVHTAGGDSTALALYAQSNCDQSKGFLLHIAGANVAGAMKEILEKAGFDVHRVVAYQAEAAKTLSEATLASIVNCELDAVMFYSPRTVKIFDALIKQARLEYLMKHVAMVALSHNIKSELTWRSTHIAKVPNNEAMLGLIDGLRSGNVE